MLRTPIAKLSILFWLALFTSAGQAESAKSEGIMTLLTAYFQEWAAMNQEKADPAATQRYNGMFKPDIVYEIPARNMKFSGQEFLDSDSHSGTVRNTVFEIESVVIGPQVAFVRATQTAEFKSSEDGWRPFTSVEHLVFEFDGDKIKRVIDY